MRKSMTALAAVFVFTACDGDPFATTTTTTTTTPTTTTVGGITLPAGTGTTGTPDSGSAITRYKTDGQTQDIRFDATTDTIQIDNLPFDGSGLFERDNVLPTLIAGPGGFQVYENNNTTERRAYKALRATSASGDTDVTVVAGGDYLGFGFGGFVYNRNGSVTLPTTGQATYRGNYAGMRTFNGSGGLQYTTANMTVEVDFEDFNATDAVEGGLSNRQFFDEAGNLLGTLPTLILATGGVNAAGEIGGTVGSLVAVPGSGFQTFETGEYYAVLSGSGANEMVGVIFLTGSDPNDVLDGGLNVTVQETGGFVLTTP